uniref:SFRICE_022328 n=1 Tax=Spodoptera frugiperda TaxID=7108 RepID=A0A2H1WJR4_SPOFR
MVGADLVRAAVVATLIAWCTAYPDRVLNRRYDNNNNNDANLEYSYRSLLSNNALNDNHNNLRSNPNNNNLNNLNNLNNGLNNNNLRSHPDNNNLNNLNNNNNLDNLNNLNNRRYKGAAVAAGNSLDRCLSVNHAVTTERILIKFSIQTGYELTCTHIHAGEAASRS